MPADNSATASTPPLASEAVPPSGSGSGSDSAGVRPASAGSRERALIDAARMQARSPSGSRGSGSGPAAERTWNPDRTPARGDSSVVAAAGAVPQAFPGFDVLREIHRGGQGVVYQAVQKATKRKVAIKAFYEGPLASVRDRVRFEREVDILAQLDHPNIVGVIDRGVTDAGAFFYVMDYVSGRTLDVYAAEPKPIDETLRLFAKICEAVNAAHLKGIIHRDIKPSNIRVDARGEPHVLDFGLAKLTAGHSDSGGPEEFVTRTGQFIGSLPWASPEQASGAATSIDIRTDVYSLGVVLYQLLTGGKFPYTIIGNMRDVLDNIMRAEPARPSTVRRQINDEVETIVLKSLSKDRERRYQSAGDLARDIQRYLRGEPIEAKRDSGWYVVSKTLSRHKLPVGAGVAFVALISLSAVLLGAMYQRASAARDEARAGRAAAIEAQREERTQRQRAEQNFEAVRRLAHTFMYDFHDEIRDLRGATKARLRLVEEARRYLDQLKDQASQDPAFLRELATAYDRLGDIQGGLFEPGTGQSAGAKESYEAALQIRRGLLDRLPGDRLALADMGESHRRLASVLRTSRGYTPALAELQEAEAMLLRSSALIPSGETAALLAVQDSVNDVRLEQADILRRLAQEADSFGEAMSFMDRARALSRRGAEYWADRLRSDPSDATAANRLGQTSSESTRGEVSLAAARIDAAKKLETADPATASSAFEQSRTQLLAAQSAAESARATFESLVRENPAQGRFARDLMLAIHNQGEAVMWSAFLESHVQGPSAPATLASHARALALFEEAADMAQRLTDSDEANVAAQRDLAMCLNKVGNQLANLGRTSEAASALDRSLALRRTLWLTDPTQVHRRDLAQALLKRAQLDQRLSLRAGFEERRALLARAASLLEEGVGHLEALRQEGALAEESEDLRRARETLEATRGLLGSSDDQP